MLVVDPALTTAVIFPERTPGVHNGNCGRDIPSSERPRRQQDQNNSRQARHISGHKHARFLSTNQPSNSKGPGDLNSKSGCDKGTSSEMQQQQQQPPRESRAPPRSIPSPRNDPSKRDKDRALPDRNRMHDRSPRDRARDPSNLGPPDRPPPDRRPPDQPDSRHRNRDVRNGSNDRLDPRDVRSDRDRNISSPNDARNSTAAGSGRRGEERGSSAGRRPSAAAAPSAREQQHRQRSRSPPPRLQQQQQRWSSEPRQRRDLDPPVGQRQQQQPGHLPASSPRGRPVADGVSPRSQQQQPPAALVIPSGAAAAAAPTPSNNAFEMLERFLGRQAALQEVLVPTAGNINTVFITKDDFLTFLSWQEWVNSYLGMKLQLLPGTYVAVPATGMEPSSSREAVEAERAVPFRIRQVKSVEINFTTNEQSEQARVLLVGGGAVEADQLGEQVLVEIPDHEALCCELASLQLQMYAPVLRLYDIAHTVWRLRLCSALEEIIKRWKQDKIELKAEGHDAEFISIAEQQAFEEIRLRIRQLPKASYMAEVAEYVDFRINDQAVLQQQLESAAAGWQQYVQHQRQRLHQQHPGQLVLPPGLAPQQQQQQQQQLPPGHLVLPPGLAPQQQQQQQPGPLLLPPGLAPQQTLLPQQQQQQQAVTVVYLPHPQQQQQQQVTQLQVGSAYLHPPGAAAAAAAGAAAAGPGYNSNPLVPLNPDPAGPIAQGFVEVDDPEFYDDPTGLGGLSPLPENPNSQAPQTLAQNSSLTQPYSGGSLGFGMGSGGGGISRVQNSSPTDVGFGSSMAQQQQQQQWDGKAPGLQPFLSKYGNERGNPSSNHHSSSGPAAAAAAFADLPPPQQQQQQQQQQSSYAYWVQQGDITAAETDPRMRRAQAHIAAMNAAHAPPAAAAAAGHELPMGRPLPLGAGDGYSQRQQQQSLLRGHDSVFERLGPVNPGDVSLDQAAAAQFIPAAQDYVAAAAAADRRHHSSSSKDREPRKQDRKDWDRTPTSRDRDRDAKAAAAAARHRSRSREKKSSKDKSKRHSSLDGLRDSRSRDSKSSREKDRATVAAAAGSRKDDRRDKAAAAAAAAKEPSPDLKDVLHRLVVGAKQMPDGVGPPSSRVPDRSTNRFESRDRREVDWTDRSQPRTRSISRDRTRHAAAVAGSRGCSHSPGWRSEKRTRTLDNYEDRGAAAAAAGSGDSRSPGHMDAVRRRFTGRLEGVDGIFNSLQQELQQHAFQAPGLPRSPDQIIKGWLHRLASMKQDGQDRGDGFFHLQYLRAHCPVPNEAIEAWGTVYNFLHNHPAIIFNVNSKLVSVNDSVDIDAVSAFPRDRQTVEPSEPRWAPDDHHEGLRPPSRQDNPGLGPSPGFNPHPRAGQGLGPLRVPDPPGPESRIMTPAGNGYTTNYSPGTAAAAIAVAELQQDTDAFSDELQRALSAAPQGYIHVAQGYRLLPPRLAAKVQRGQPIDLVKFVQDNMSDVEIVHKPGVEGLVIQRVPPGRIWQRPRVCAYWNPDRWSSCKKGSICDFKHDLLSSTL